VLRPGKDREPVTLEKSEKAEDVDKTNDRKRHSESEDGDEDDRKSVESWKLTRDQLARERERKMELLETEREKSGPQAERVDGLETKETVTQGRLAKERNFYLQRLQNIQSKQTKKQLPILLRKGNKELPPDPRSLSTVESMLPSPSSTTSVLNSRKAKKLMESEMKAHTKFMAKALRSYKGGGRHHLSFARGASVRGMIQSLAFYPLATSQMKSTVLVVNDEEGMFYGCCNRKVGWFPSFYVKPLEPVVSTSISEAR